MLRANLPVAYTPERRVCADNFLSFDPWHALGAYRPLGAHSRVRRAAYAMSSRAERAPKREPREASEFFVV